MGLSSSQMQPQELITFKKLPPTVSLNDIEVPERAENRRPTNVKWLIGLGVFTLLLLPFLIYTLCYADASRIIVGYDNCGNTCGKKNYQWEGISCSGKDYRDFPYLEFDSYRGADLDQDFVLSGRKCVQSCKEGYTSFLGKCRKQINKYQLDSYPGHDVTRERYEDKDLDFGVYLNSAKWQIIISCLLSILIALGMLFLFRYAISLVVWGILLGCFIGLLVLIIAYWYFYTTLPQPRDTNDQSKSNMLITGIVLTIFVVGLGVVMVWSRKKVRLVILLLKETTRAVFDMPSLTLIPLICVLFLLIITAIFALVSFYALSAGTLKQVTSEFYQFVQTPVMTFTIFYNAVVYLWFTQFFTGIQYMIIAGAVSKWYFTRDKSYLGSPIMSSATIALKYHLGTVAMGSFIITLIQVIKSIILSLCKNEKVRCLVQCCIEAVEDFFKFLSKNAYIITAMHGQGFLRSGKRAAKLIIQNVSDIIAVNFIGDFILGIAKLLVVIVSLLISAGVFAIAPSQSQMNDFYGYVIIGVFALIVALVAFGVFETTIDTLFICYCEDNLLNDGMSKPYYMSRNLMEFVQESKQIYGKKN